MLHVRPHRRTRILAFFQARGCGGAEGRTHRGVPVYNVALPALRTLGDAPYRVFEV